MARTNVVKSARKVQGTCRSCRKEINIGDGYKWAKPRYGARVVVCGSCQITVSMTSSSKMVAVWEAQESFDTTGNIDDIVSALESLAEVANEVGQEYQEAADNQREYFPDSDVAADNEDKASQLEDWAGSLESAGDDIKGMQDEISELQEELDNISDDTEEASIRRTEIAEEIEGKLEEARSQADEAAGDCPV